MKNMKARRVQVGLVQMQCSRHQEENMAKALDLCRNAAEQGAKIICLPELFLTPYFCQHEDAALFDLAETIPGVTTQNFEQLASAYDCAIIVSLFEKRTAGLYHNTVALIDGVRGLAGIYRKMHIPDDPRYYEKFYFTPGDTGFKSFNTPYAQIGTLVCWDQWFPEAARLTALQGAEILFYPTAIGWHPEEKERLGIQQHSAWEISMRAHAIANGCFVVAVNRTGFEPTPNIPGEGISFWGQSFVAGPDGEVIFRESTDQEHVAVIEINLDDIEEMRRGWPFFRDRRIDAYSPLTQRFIDSR